MKGELARLGEHHATKLSLTDGISVGRLDDRLGLLRNFDKARRDMDAAGHMAAMDVFTRQAYNILTSGTRPRQRGPGDARALHPAHQGTGAGPVHLRGAAGRKKTVDRPPPGRSRRACGQRVDFRFRHPRQQHPAHAPARSDRGPCALRLDHRFAQPPPARRRHRGRLGRVRSFAEDRQEWRT